MKLLLAASSAAIALACASSASASTVINFNEYIYTTPGPYGEKSYTSLTTQGFKITNSFNTLFIRQANHIYNPDPGGANLYIPFGGTTKFERVDGALFTLDSLEFADGSNDGSTTSFQLTFFDGLKTGTRTLTYDRLKGFQTADLNLQKIQWFSLNTQTQIDDITVSVPAVGGVPEPATWALMIMGFGAAGATLRRRRTQFLGV
ncbi:MAG: PEPxxWA-CTERM sorting domain-containing protein [Pseudomonadota bacterium]